MEFKKSPVDFPKTIVELLDNGVESIVIGGHRVAFKKKAWTCNKNGVESIPIRGLGLNSRVEKLVGRVSFSEVS